MIVRFNTCIIYSESFLSEIQAVVSRSVIGTRTNFARQALRVRVAYFILA